MINKITDQRTVIMLATQAVKRNASRLVNTMSDKTMERIAESEQRVQLARQELLNATLDANNAFMNIINQVEQL